jgi:hypothetical protein
MMATRNHDDHNDATTHERPSSFREMLYRDRRLLSRRQMDRRIRDRAAERDEANGNGKGHPTYFPTLSRWFGGDTASEVRAVVVVAALIVGAFLFGRWVGQQDAEAPDPQSAPAVAVVA